MPRLTLNFDAALNFYVDLVCTIVYTQIHKQLTKELSNETTNICNRSLLNVASVHGRLDDYRLHNAKAHNKQHDNRESYERQMINLDEIKAFNERLRKLEAEIKAIKKELGK